MHPLIHVLKAARRGGFIGPEFWDDSDQAQAEEKLRQAFDKACEKGFRFGGRGFWGGGGGHWGHHGFPPGMPGMPGWPHGGGRRGRVRRGDVRAAILALLAEQPRNGYQLIQEISERSGGVWKPSPGSIYPALQQLEDEGLVWADNSEGKRLFALTKAGEAYVKEKPEDAAPPWEGLADSVPETMQDYHALLGQVMGAAAMVSQAATPGQLEKARQLLIQTRKGLYQILAEDGED